MTTSNSAAESRFAGAAGRRLTHLCARLLVVLLGLTLVSLALWRFRARLAVPLAVAVCVARVAFVVTDAFRRRRERLRNRRRWAHRCIVCGYSLTGNVSGVCPECGTPEITA